MIVVTLVVAAVFIRIYLSALAEAPSVDSGPNFLFTSIMALIVLTLGRLPVSFRK